MVRKAYRGFLCALLASTPTLGDQLIYQYEGDVLPTDPSAGWTAIPCVPPSCIARLEGGHFVLEFPPVGVDFANHNFQLDAVTGEIPPTLWVEWSYRSNVPRNPTDSGCDGAFFLGYREIEEVEYLYGDAVESRTSGGGVLGLDPAEFQTHRFESLDGKAFRFSINGAVYFEDTEIAQGRNGRNLQFQGFGACNADQIKINQWDFIRFGTIDADEQIASFDPPVDPSPIIPLDRFRVVFDRPGYVYVTDIEVTTTAGVVPVVKKTWRRDGDGPETLEVVLDRLLPTGETTTFRFPTAGGVTQVSYTPVAPPAGACCLPNKGCSLNVTGDACLQSGGNYQGDGSTSCTHNAAGNCIPTVSGWGLAALLLSLLIAATIAIARRKRGSVGTAHHPSPS